jgi:hypothetical protein
MVTIDFMVTIRPDQQQTIASGAGECCVARLAISAANYPTPQRMLSKGVVFCKKNSCLL